MGAKCGRYLLLVIEYSLLAIAKPQQMQQNATASPPLPSQQDLLALSDVLTL